MFLLIGIALVAAAGLAFQIALTRIFAIAQGYHFGFLAISLALLGFGASGTALALRPALARGEVLHRLARWSLAFSVCLVASYLAIHYLPFDAYRVAYERVQLVYLVLYYLALVAPFFVGGLVLGVPLAAFPARAARAYAANLAGSGLGCLAALGALAWFGEVGAVIFAALIAALGAGAFALAVTPNTRLLSSSVALVVLWLVLLLVPSRAFDVQLSPYRALSQTLLLPDARIVFSATNAFSRVQVVESRAIRSAPGLSLTYSGELPAQRALFKDAESLSPLTDTAPPALLAALPVTLAYRLRPQARALILEPGGGLEVLAALHAGAREIVVVEENPLIAHVARQYAPHTFADARVRVVTVGARSFLARTREKFDIVHLALSEPFRPVTAGAYALGENYLYTREAFREYLAHLNDDGLLVVHRWLQLPPTEETRAGVLALIALEDFATDDPPASVSEHLLALRSFSTMLLLVKRTPFTAREIASARAFAETQQFDWVAAPNLDVRETNRYHFLPHNDYLAAFQPVRDRAQRTTFLAAYAYDLTPPTDDRPFFFHFFKWEQTPQVWQLLGKTWQPFGGSGYLILLALLVLSVLVSVTLILAPLVALRAQFAAPLARAPRTLIYFAALGIGFLFVEVPLIQRFILFLDQPVYAFATVVFALLLASGVGSFVSVRVPWRGALGALVIAIVLYPWLLPFVFTLTLGYAFEWRVLIAFVLLAPLGFLMGIPFPKGIARLNASAPNLVPLAWGVNGCASVISSILGTLGALTFGFLVVMFVGAGMYVVATWCRE